MTGPWDIAEAGIVGSVLLMVATQLGPGYGLLGLGSRHQAPRIAARDGIPVFGSIICKFAA